jgi:dihydropteroate synthase
MLLQLGRHALDLQRRTAIMSIINVTPDSFSGDGLAREADMVAAALAVARRAADEGADILDVGGESTRPGAAPVGVEEEQRRVLPVIEALARAIDLPISIDTYHAETAAAALDSGAVLVNDVWGLRAPEGGWNEPLAALAAARDAPLVVTHNRRARATSGAIGGHYAAVEYDDVVATVVRELGEQVEYAIAHGIRRERLIIDPGIGFGKTPDQNMVLLRGLSALQSLGLPILLGASRKSFIGKALDLPADERDEGTAAVTAFGIERGAAIVRVHNVRLNARVARMTDALVRG